MTFKKGQSGNPLGVPGLPAEIRAARRDHREAVIKLMHLYAGLTSEQAQQRMDGNTAIQLEEMIQAVIVRAKGGDPFCFKFMVETMCGKIPEVDEVQLPALDEMTLEQKIDTLKQAVTFLEAQAKIEGADGTNGR